MKLSVGGDDSLQNEFGQLLSNFPQAQVHNRKQKKGNFSGNGHMEGSRGKWKQFTRMQ